MSKFIKIGNKYIRKKSIISIHLDKSSFDNNNVNIKTTELCTAMIRNLSYIEHVTYNIPFAEKSLDAEEYFNHLIKELEY